MTMGQRILQLRKELNMTQKQLAGEKITRNMLSQIENGTARPSMQTLQYLAERLGVSTALLMGQDQPNGDLDGARRYFAAGNYTGALRLADGRGNKEERNLLLSLSAVGEARRFYDSGSVGEARALAIKALHWNSRTIYGTKSTELSARAILMSCNFYEGNYSARELNEFRSVYEAMGWETNYHLLCAANYLGKGDIDSAKDELDSIGTATGQSNCARLLLLGRIEMEGGRPREAISLLKQAEATEPRNVFILREIYKLLEQAGRETENYKCAYEYATKLKNLQKEQKIPEE